VGTTIVGGGLTSSGLGSTTTAAIGAGVSAAAAPKVPTPKTPVRRIARRRTEGQDPLHSTSSSARRQRQRGGVGPGGLSDLRVPLFGLGFPST